ncbi:MAG: 4,4-diaponeurosporenoate glycosyltransferase [Thermotogaceae bacterium]|nr:4,4-diaponeurosporenoate glycosyltransferase [Thermotogaceae bacterium]
MFKISVILAIVISIYYIISARKSILRKDTSKNYDLKSLSVIIPARNEEFNISKILNLLLQQTIHLDEIIIVNDNSTDNTETIVREYIKSNKNIKLVNLKEEPPKGWVGKSWAIWNGVKNSKGDILIFFDADVEPEKNAIEVLLKKYNEGLLTVWPYQRFEKFYEHLSLAANIITVYGSNAFGFLKSKPSGAFGPVMVTSREDYFSVGGHESIKDSVLEDTKLGKLYISKGKRVKNYLGNGIIKFRMYPKGIKQLFEGHTKNMASGSISGGILYLILDFIWMVGIYSSIFSPSIKTYPVFIVLIYLLSRRLGDYKWYDYLFYPVHFIFFLIIFAVSLVETTFIKKVVWKGRKISV